jgi:hypothetical protein
MESTEPRQLFVQTLELLEKAFRRLETQVPPPKRKPWKDGFVFRYAEQTIQQAIVQKLARTISGLHAVDTLLYQIPGILTRWGFQNRRRSDSRWRTKEVRHVGSDTIAARF